MRTILCALTHSSSSLGVITHNESDVADWARDGDREDHGVATGILSTVLLLPYMEVDHSGFIITISSTDHVHNKGSVSMLREA